jgi:hypothetical protein
VGPGLTYNRRVAKDAAVREELNTALAARRELGEELEPAVVDAFVERIEKRIDKRVGNSENALKRKQDHQKEMILGSMGISIPLMAIAAVFTGLQGVVVVCLVLAVIAIVSTRD